MQERVSGLQRAHAGLQMEYLRLQHVFDCQLLTMDLLQQLIEWRLHDYVLTT